MMTAETMRDKVVDCIGRTKRGSFWFNCPNGAYRVVIDRRGYKIYYSNGINMRLYKIGHYNCADSLIRHIDIILGFKEA